MAICDLGKAELTELFLTNQLSNEDRQEFLQILDNNPDFREYLSLFQEIDQAIGQQDVMMLRQDLDNIFDAASEKWLNEAPMLIAENQNDEIEAAIIENDIMNLRSLLKDIHELHRDEFEYDGKQQQTPAPEILITEPAIHTTETVSPAFDIPEDEIDMAIMEADVMNLRSQLQDIANQSQQVSTGRPWFRRISSISAAAAVIIMLIVGGTFWLSFSDQGLKPEKLVDKYFEPINYRSPVRGESAADFSRWMDKAYSHYRDGNYKEALEFFEILEEESQGSPEIVTHAGICLWKLNRPKEALEHFNEVISDQDNAYVEDAQWFSVACLILDNEREEAVALLRRLALIPGHDREDMIKEVLKELEKN